MSALDEDGVRQNLETWNRWTDINYESELYDVEGFKAGRDTIDALEVEGVGDVTGKSLLHLQCHFGMDTLSWARRGARVTGVDFSPVAIARARALAAELGLEATFVESEVAHAAQVVDGLFDVVFTSYGAISWLPDLAPWARTIAAKLAPGGTFFVADHHPALWVYDDTEGQYDEHGRPAVRLKYGYFDTSALRDESKGNYAQPDHPDTHVTYSWQHTFEDIVGSLIDAGLRITSLKEYDCIAWAWFEWMVKGEDGLWRMPPEVGDIPLMFSITATRD